MSSSESLPAEGVRQRRSTTQAKDWRPVSTIHLRNIWQKTWSQIIMTPVVVDEEQYLVREEGQRGPAPSIPLWVDQAFLIPTTFATPVIQRICFEYGWKWSPWLTFGIYMVSFMSFVSLSSFRFNSLGNKYGNFNEHVRGRDRIPDESVDIMGGGIVWYFLWRIGTLVYFNYKPDVAPLSDFNFATYIFRFSAWFLIMDYFFYIYHRATHEVDFLWRIHQYHHKSKSPTAAHAILAGHAQHFMEIVAIPGLTSYLVPMSFHEMWVLALYLGHIETMGHSGVRIHCPNPNSFLFTMPFGADLTIEDHDLHHRYGKSGKNFGKQTRFWDWMFGTMEERVETKDSVTRWIFPDEHATGFLLW
ncbi:hypothetical protein MNV49_005634 [Pseudohyphozyma bogoriensis]|nr:hypothetical protein MNV49_005634 [Pseudohyphozyma bogoriensis]